MTHREHFFQVLEGKKPSNMPFFPDMTDWYIFHRTPAGKPRQFEPGQFVSDYEPIHHYSGTLPEKYKDFTLWYIFHRTPAGKPRQFEPGQFVSDYEPIHHYPGTLPEKYRDFSLLDFYREFDWGFFAHIYDWYDEEYSSPVEKIIKQDEQTRQTIFRTPKGEVRKVEVLAADGTWAPKEHFVKTLDQLEIVRLVVDATRFVPRFERVEAILQQLGGQGVGDNVIFYSPFGKLVHEYMGFEQVVYALVDHPDTIHDFLAFQEHKDLELVRLAADSPERLVIISDHPDEYLISPRYYHTYCIPFYRKSCEILQKAGKFVSNHLDGNCKGFFPYLARTGFDYLDGCTPAPMMNFEIEELAQALPENMKTFCGVPSVLFCHNVANDVIFSYAERIMTALKGRGILNVGDILPPDGDIEQVIALGEYVKSAWE